MKCCGPDATPAIEMNHARETRFQLRFPVASAFRTAAALIICLLSACATTPPPSPPATTVCLPLKAYSKEQEQAVARTLAALPSDSLLATFLSDYGAMRAADRACLGAHP